MILFSVHTYIILEKTIVDETKIDFEIVSSEFHVSLNSLYQKNSYIEHSVFKNMAIEIKEIFPID